MKTKSAKTVTAVLFLALSLATSSGQTTAFLYQGLLHDGAGPAEGFYDLRFELFAQASGGSAAAGPHTNSLVVVSNGLFRVTLDFGASVFDGTDRWLEIGVRTNGAADNFTTLDPRHPILAVPYAVHTITSETSSTALGVPAGSITEAMLSTPLSANLARLDATQNFTGNLGVGATNPQAPLHVGAGRSIGPREARILSELRSDNSLILTSLNGASAAAQYVSPSLVYVVSPEDDALTILNVANPARPRLGRVFRNGENGVTSLDGAAAVAVDGLSSRLLVAAAGSGAVSIFDIFGTSLLHVARDGVGGFNDLAGANSIAVNYPFALVTAPADDAVTVLRLDSTGPFLMSVMKDGVAGFGALDGVASVAFDAQVHRAYVVSPEEDAVSIIGDIGTGAPSSGVGTSRLLAEIRDGVGSFQDLDGASSVAAYTTGTDRYILVAAAVDEAVSIINVNDPENPQLVTVLRDKGSPNSAFQYLAGASSVSVSFNRAYVAARADNALTILDIANPASPRLVSVARDGLEGFDFLRGASSVSVLGQMACITAQDDDALTLVDLSKPSIAPPVFQIANGERPLMDPPSSVFVSDNVACLVSRTGNSFATVDISDPTAPRILTSIQDGDEGFNRLESANSITVEGHLAFITAGLGLQAGLTIADISNPSAPQVRAELVNGSNGFHGLSGAKSVAVQGSLAYVAAFGGGFSIIDVSQPSSPQLRSELRDGTNGFNHLFGANSVVVAGTVAYVAAARDHALNVFDVANPAAPRLLAVVTNGWPGVDKMEGAYSVFVQDNVAFVAATTGRAITVLDVSNPAQPVFLTTLPHNLFTSPATSLLSGRTFWGAGNLLYASENGNLVLYDITNPSAPTLLDQVPLETDLSFGGNSVHAQGPLAFVISGKSASGYGSLLTLSFEAPGVGLIVEERVGIGTTNPQSELEVEGTVTATAFSGSGEQLHSLRNLASNVVSTANLQDGAVIAAKLQDDSVTSAKLQDGAVTGAKLAPGALSQLNTPDGTQTGIVRVSNSAMVGVGTANPSAKLHVVGDLRVEDATQVDLRADRVAIGATAQAAHDGTFVWADDINDVDFTSTGTNQFLVRAGGGVGIGLTQPRHALHVGTTLGISALNASTHRSVVENSAEDGRAAFLALAGPGGSSATNRVELQLEANELQRRAIIGTASNHEVLFRQNNFQRLLLATNGNIGINESFPDASLHIAGIATATHLHLEQTQNNGFARLRLSAVTKPSWDLAVGGANNVVNFFSAGGNGNVMTLTTNGNLTTAGTVNGVSDRAAKERFTPVDSREILEKVAQLPLARWHYKTDPGVAHLGPVAQDFHAAFGVGADDKHIATVDADGVALAAIQGLNDKVEVRSMRAERKIQETETGIKQLKQELQARDVEIGELKRTVSELKELIQRLAPRSAEGR